MRMGALESVMPMQMSGIIRLKTVVAEVRENVAQADPPHIITLYCSITYSMLLI